LPAGFDEPPKSPTKVKMAMMAVMIRHRKDRYFKVASFPIIIIV
jgi:hypothetical protein